MMDANKPADEKQHREPYCWIEKRKLRMIGDVFEENTGSINAARSIYLGLAEIASDKASDTFDASQADIAHRAGLSLATVKRILPKFRQLGLIRVKRNSINGIETRSTYTLIRGTLAHCEPTLAQQPKTKRATLEESTKKASNCAARKKSSVSSSTRGNSLAGRCEGFNSETEEYEW